MATGIELLHYGCQREMVAQYESYGHTATIRRNRNGWLCWKLDQRKTELCTRDAMERIEIAIHEAKTGKTA